MELTGPVLLLWSGGVESTSLLSRLLAETDLQVHTHFIEMINPENRWGCERAAIDALLPAMQGIRAFDHTETTLRVHAGKVQTWDYLLQYPIGLVMMKHKGCRCVLRAGCLEDDWDHVTDLNTGDVRFERPDPAPGASHRRRARALAGSLGADFDPAVLAPYLEAYTLPKAMHVRYLGGLFPLTWSCRRPVGGKACGVCHACKERDAAVRGTSLIPEIAKLLEDADHETD